ncbi:MAG: HEAT repeat domain-containing protein [Terriglobales bacterium]|jgi:HEAT repeat protein
MGFISSAIEALGPAGLVLQAIVISLLGILLLVGFIILRRWYRGRYFRRRNGRTVVLRAQWDDIVSGKISPLEWRFNPLDCEIVESILLDNIEMGTPETLPGLLDCLRKSGLLDMRVRETRGARGWRRRTALIALGRTRAFEAIPALAEALDSRSRETRIAAVRGLGRIARMDAAIPMLERMLMQLDVPEHTLKSALVKCCSSHPGILVNYVARSHGSVRQLLARVLGELASPDLGEDLLVLAADPLPEVRGSAARALGRTNTSFTLPALHSLVNDPEWFVRLRAVVALGQIENIGKIRPLLQALCDANRYVRQRAAWALARMEPQLEQILEDVVATKDEYALQALISELERSGAIEKFVGAMELGVGSGSAETLRDVVDAARNRVGLNSKASAVAAGAH